MIKYISKFILVILMLGFIAKPASLSAQTPPEKNSFKLTDITSEQMEAYQELAQEVIKSTKPDFDKMYDYELLELGDVKNSNSYKLYQESLRLIDLPKDEQGAITNPGLVKDYNTAYEGSISSSVMTNDGELAVAWSNGEPIVITSEPETFERTLYIPEEVNRESSSFKRLIYHMHVFDGDNGFGLSDVKAPTGTTFRKRAMVSFHNFRKRYFARGTDLKLVSVNSNGKFVKLERSKKPKYMSGQYFKEYWGAMFHGRPATKAKIKKAFFMAGLAGGLSLAFTNTAMASVMTGFSLLIYTHYEGYLTFKFTNSTLMQITKLAAVTTLTGTLYTLIQFGLDAGFAEWAKMFENVGKGVAIFYTASLAKRLLVLSGKVKKMVSITRISLPKYQVGKKIHFLGVTLTMPESIGIGNVKMSAAKVHDMIQDSLISLGRQLDLVKDMGPAFIPMIFAGLHVYAKAIYYTLGLNKKPLDPMIETVNDEIFFKKIFKNVARSFKSVCRKIYQSPQTGTN